MNKMYFTVIDSRLRGDEFYQKTFGQHAVISRLGKVTLIHLDCPNAHLIRSRIEEITKERLAATCDCPICRDYKDHPLDVVYF